LEHVVIGKSQIKVPRLCIGSWQISGVSEANDRTFKAVVSRAIELGLTFFDTAELYGNGHSESLLGQALQKKRDKVVMASKFRHSWAAPEKVRKALDHSLKRLRTDYIDLYQYHWPSPVVPLTETLDELFRLKAQGKIRSVGVSNWMEPEWAEVDDDRIAKIDSLQNCYSLLWRPLEQNVLGICKKNQISLLAYSPLCQGLLTGRFKTLDDAPSDARTANRFLKPESFEQILPVVSTLEAIAKERNKSASQVALRWLLDQNSVSSVIVGSSSVSQLDDNFGALGWSLQADELEALDKISKPISLGLNPHDTLWGWHSRAA